jgi:hypothetical protein
MRSRRSLAFAVVLPLATAAALAACSGSPGGSPHYPRRAPGCALSVYNGVPEVKVYDDIGIAQVDCYLDESEIACLSRLRVEACRMGGDILYNVPKKAMRPVERGMIYRAQVAHSRDAKKADEAPAPADAGSGPVEPLQQAAPAPVRAPGADGGGQ